MKAEVKNKEGREVVAVVYCGDFVMKGENGQAVFLTSKFSKSPPSNTATTKEHVTFENIVQSVTSRDTLVYTGMEVTLRF